MKAIFFLAAAAIVALPASAATISTSDYTKGSFDAAIGSMSSSVVETFESFTEGNIADGWSDSAVGSFSSVGGEGSGGTVSDSVASGNFAGNDGTKLALRDGNVYGRRSTTENYAGGMFLDSNDTYGIRWEASLGGGMFNRIVLTLTDAADVGATMKIRVGQEVYTLTGLGNGARKLVEISFGEAVSTATILFENYNGQGAYKRNDGFSLDDIALSAVPLPPGALLLVGGLGALGAMRRKKRAA